MGIGEAKNPGPGPGALPEAPHGFERVQPVSVCFRSVKTIIGDPEYKGPSKTRPTVEKELRYFVRKRPVNSMADLINVKNREGEDVGCLTDAEYFVQTLYDGDVKAERPLRQEAFQDSSGEWTIRVCCGDKKKSKHYARKIVACVFHRGRGPVDYDTSLRALPLTRTHGLEYAGKESHVKFR